MIIKQMFVAISALGLSMTALAGYPSDEVMPVAAPTVNVTIPQQMGSWSVGLEALYEESNNGDFHYAASQHVVTNTAPTLSTDDRRVHGVDMDNDWGGHIDLAYNFAGDGRYVKLGYTHLTVNDSDRFERQPNDLLRGVGIGAAPLVIQPVNPTTAVADWDDAEGRSKSKYDAVDLVFGQRFDFGQKVTLDAFGGLRYVNLSQKDEASYHQQTSATVTEFARLGVNSEFNGLGPRAGFNGQVRLGSGFSIVGTMAGSLVVGESESSARRLDQVTTSGAFSTHQARADKVSESTVVVPELDARLGVNYTASFTPDTAVGIELGYEVVNYFDVNNNSQVSYADTVNHMNDFAMQGPYLRVQVDIA